MNYSPVMYPTPENCFIPPQFRPMLVVPIVARCEIKDEQLRYLTRARIATSRAVRRKS